MSTVGPMGPMGGGRQALALMSTRALPSMLTNWCAESVYMTMCHCLEFIEPPCRHA